MIFFQNVSLVKQECRDVLVRKTGRIVISFVLFSVFLCNMSLHAAQKINLDESVKELILSVGETKYTFSSSTDGKWFFSHIQQGRKKIVSALNENESFFRSSGRASNYEILGNNLSKIKIRFSGLENHPGASVVYTVEAADKLPRLQVSIEGVASLTCAYRSAATSQNPHGTWITRGETACDAEGKEVFIDGSGPFVFGHSMLGKEDISYVWQAKTRPVKPRRGTEQRSNTFFKSGIVTQSQSSYTYWQLRIGADEPKEYAMVWDYNLGGRVHDVFEKYYSDIIDSQVDISRFDRSYNATLAVEKMPIRLSSPEAFIPGYGWMMEEYYPNGHRSAYPFGHECGIQTAALLSYEGFATQRDWEKNFGFYVLDKLPMWSDINQGYFVKRDGGYTRWCYSNDYKNPFPLLEGGNWGAAEQIYLIARLSGDEQLRKKAVSLMKHDVDVKLDAEHFYFPPCWNPDTRQLTVHRDDWFITGGLGYCAVVCEEILYPETNDKRYLELADKLTDWLSLNWREENKMNFLHPGVNTFHCFSGWIIKAMIRRYERSKDESFLDIAKDLTWVMAATLCMNDTKLNGKSLFGVTCVGTRGCVDYDCFPNLCHEKDLCFIESMGILAKYVSGESYAKYLSMQSLRLPQDRWLSAWVQEQRDLNLRTNYDNWARGITNLSFGINTSSNRQIQLFDCTVAVKSLTVSEEREIVAVNATSQTQQSTISIPYLKNGKYALYLDGKRKGIYTSSALKNGFSCSFSANGTVKITVKLKEILPEESYTEKNEKRILLDESLLFDAQRGVGYPQPIYRMDKSFMTHPLMDAEGNQVKGFGLAANTVLAFKLDRKFSSFEAVLSMDDAIKKLTKPDPSVNVTFFADGRLCFESGKIDRNSAPLSVKFSLDDVDVLIIRVSGNYDDDGNLKHDMVNLLSPYLCP